jgi:hypothetical protein
MRINNKSVMTHENRLKKITKLIVIANEVDEHEREFTAIYHAVLLLLR